MLKLLLIGHRGVGKSSFLKRGADYCSTHQIACLSLDEEIESRTGRSILSIFAQGGESEFRRIEKEIFSQLTQEYQNQEHIIDLGGGFRFDKPQGYQVLWLSRVVDLSQSQFLDRPSLDGNLKISPQRFQEREKFYSSVADVQWQLREGESRADGFTHLMDWLRGENLKKSDPNWHMTVLNDQQADFLLSQPQLPFQLEWRDDLVSLAHIEKAQKLGRADLISLRNPELRTHWQKQPPEGCWDWPLEWGGNTQASFLSLHQRKASVHETLASLPPSSAKQKVKLAIPIHDFHELEEGWRWQQADATHRAFLPMSPDGRWRWFRLILARTNALNFLRMGVGSAVDQPTWNEVLSIPQRMNGFAAVLGSPVKQSQTPTFHQDFFAQRDKAVVAIELGRDEFKQALPFLERLGLGYGAVTSPLKEIAGEWAQAKQAINTLYLGDSLRTASTDVEGFRLITQNIPVEEIAVWGGGGVLDALKALHPQVACYSSRTGQLKSGVASPSPSHLIWAVGAQAFLSEGVWPPAHWPIQAIHDLSYTLDSPGIELAAKLKCQYHSGLEFFHAQGRAQQAFWAECESQQ